MKKYIVVTGGAGFIGSNLIKFLIKKNYHIISLDNYSAGSIQNHITNSKIRYIKGNTRDINDLLLKYKKNIKVIFHFGEFSRIHSSFLNIEKCIQSNIIGTAAVINFCLQNKIKIIYSATSASLGNQGRDQNLSPYALTKAKNLKLLIHLNRWFNLSYEIVYFYNVYGNGHIKTGNMATVIGIFEHQTENKLPLTVVKPGIQSRTFTHIEDTIEGCYLAWKKNKNRHYALSNNKSYTIIEIAKMFGGKITYLNKKLGERYRSAKVNKIGNIKIYNIRCKKNIKLYIDNFLKGM
jgi:UDP-glucose 4-epimerase